MSMIPYGKHFIDEEDIDAVVDILRNGPLTQGPKIAEFEQQFAEFVNSKYAVAVSSCTAGLHIASIAAGLKKGDTLITSPITFVASSNAALYVGANVEFADINPYTVNMDPRSLASTLNNNPNVKVVIPVHFAGLPCEMENIQFECEKANVAIIEDAAHALGSKYRDGRMVGSCCFSLMTVFSLHPVKAIAAGEGGVITTNDESVYRQLLRLRSHGINKAGDQIFYPEEATSESGPNPWYYEMQELGFHYRITDIQCALASSQLNKLSKFVLRRKQIARRYFDAFSDINCVNYAQPREVLELSSLHLFVLRINFSQLKLDRAKFMRLLRLDNIITQVHYLPVPMHPIYRLSGARLDQVPNSMKYYNECISIPIYYSLSDEDQEYVITRINNILLKHSK